MNLTSLVFKQRYLIVAQELKHLLVQNLLNGAAKIGFKTKIKTLRNFQRLYDSSHVRPTVSLLLLKIYFKKSVIENLHFLRKCSEF